MSHQQRNNNNNINININTNFIVLASLPPTHPPLCAVAAKSVGDNERHEDRQRGAGHGHRDEHTARLAVAARAMAMPRASRQQVPTESSAARGGTLHPLHRLRKGQFLLTRGRIEVLLLINSYFLAKSFLTYRAPLPNGSRHFFVIHVRF